MKYTGTMFQNGREELGIVTSYDSALYRYTIYNVYLGIWFNVTDTQVENSFFTKWWIAL